MSVMMEEGLEWVKDFVEEHTGVALAGMWAVVGAALYGYEYIREHLSDDGPPQKVPKASELEKQQKAKMEALKAKIERRNKENDDYFCLTDEILSLLKEHAVRLNMALPGAESQVDILRNKWKELNAFEQEERQGRWAEVMQLYNLAHGLETDYLDFETRWLEAYDRWIQARSNVQYALTGAEHYLLQINTSEGVETVEVNCLHWSRGAMKDIDAQLPDAEQPEETTLSAFAAMTQQAQTVLEQIEQHMRSACEAFINKEMRIQISESILQTLTARGWECEEYAFAGEDERESLIILMRNPAQDSLKFTLEPGSRINMQMTMRDVHNRSVLQSVAQVMRDALAQNGVTIKNVNVG